MERRERVLPNGGMYEEEGEGCPQWRDVWERREMVLPNGGMYGEMDDVWGEVRGFLGCVGKEKYPPIEGCVNVQVVQNPSTHDRLLHV